MNLEDQVCSLELAKQLVALGFYEDSMFYYVNIDGEGKYYVYHDQSFPEDFEYEGDPISAYTSDELMNLLPAFIDIKQNEPYNNFYLQIQKRTVNNIKYIARYVCDTMPGEESYNPAYQMQSRFKSHSPKLADCLAELLIELKEDLIK